MTTFVQISLARLREIAARYDAIWTHLELENPQWSGFEVEREVRRLIDSEFPPKGK